MSTSRLLPRLIAWILWLVSAAAFAGDPVPTLTIERTVWALEEDIFFWSGVRTDGEMEPGDIEGCGVEILGPDDFRHWSPTLWPTDGNPWNGWTAGRGLSASQTVVGTYRVLARCQGQIVEAEFEVRRMDILDQIDLRVEFEPGCGDDSDDETVSIVLENQSSFPLVAAPPFSLIGNDVGVTLRHRDTGAVSMGFVPRELLGVAPTRPGNAMLDRLDWDDLHHLTPDRVEPGGSVRRSFCLKELAGVSGSEMAWPPGSVSVSFSTQVLVGPRDGPWADAGPFRLSAGEERFLERGWPALVSELWWVWLPAVAMALVGLLISGRNARKPSERSAVSW